MNNIQEQAEKEYPLMSEEQFSTSGWDCFDTYEHYKSRIYLLRQGYTMGASIQGNGAGVWVKELEKQIKELEQVEGELVSVKTFPTGSIALKFKNGNGYWISINKQAQVILD